ncbi:hypothetical protein T484DRAFT_1804593 [Baffinella frigidus]|nr:hypothetical protein T484DRAFT_1804593 [Cryptophyta sp. CCMP2293]
MIEWVRQADNGNRPEPSAGATAVSVDGKLWVFGGNMSVDPDDQHLSHDLHVFDLETGFWTRCRTSPTQPCARAGHCMVAHGSSMYVLCGWTVNEDNRVLYLSDAFVHSSTTLLWSPIRASGTPPVARAYAAACAHRGKIFLFGGVNGSVASSFRNDLMVLSIETLSWMEMLPVGAAPNGRLATNSKP